MIPSFTSLCRVVAVCLLCSYIMACTSFSKGLDKVPVAGRLVGDDGYFRDRRDEYLEAGTIPDTIIPDTMDSYIIDDLYVIPEVNSSQQLEVGQVPRPRSLEGKSDREVVIQTIEDNSWIVAGASPSQIWPRLKDYWVVNNVLLDYENPTTGVMETTWFELKDQGESQEKFHISIENGFQDNSSEIRLQHVSSPLDQPVPANVDFSIQTGEDETGDEVLRSISVYLAEIADIYQAASVSFLAGNISDKGRASLSTMDDGNVQMRLNADYDRSWAAVGLALSRVEGVEVLKSTKADGIYELSYVPVIDEDEKPGFLGRLFSNGSDSAYTLRLQLLPSGDAVFVEGVELSIDGQPVEDIDAVNQLVQSLRRVIA